MNLSKSKIVIITGKGGVGKSTISLALAMKEAKAGKRVLLVELGTSGFFSQVSGKNTAFSPTQPFGEVPNLHLAKWTGRESLEEYVLSVLRLKPVVNAFFGHSVMKALIEAAPALSDVAILGKLTSGQREVRPQLDFDLVVLDGYATGHFLAMMKAPLGLADAIRVGPMGTQSREIHQVLCDSDVCSYGVVTLPEEMALQEALEIQTELKSHWGVQPTIICNQLIPVVDLQETSTVFTEFLAKKYSHQREVLGAISESAGDLVCIDQVYDSKPMERIQEIAKKMESL